MGVLILSLRTSPTVPGATAANEVRISRKASFWVFFIFLIVFVMAGCGGTVGLNATATSSDAALAVTPTSVDFGHGRLGTTTQRFVRITNRSTAPVTIISISPTADFEMQKVSLPIQLAGSSSLDVVVGFTPKESRTYRGALTVTYSPPQLASGVPAGTLPTPSGMLVPVGLTPSQQAADSGIPVVTSMGSSSTQVSLQGNGGATPILSVTPKSMAFGTQTVNTSSAPQSVTLTNAGNANLQLQSMSVTGPFGVAGWPGPTILPPSGSLSLQVTFIPTAPGSSVGALAIYSDAKSSPTNVRLSGYGASIVAPSALVITTTSLPGGDLGVAYQAFLQATGGTPGYTWSIISGSLPPGLTLAATTGEISGTSSTSGTYSFTVRVTDSGSPAQSASRSFTINMAGTAPLTITTSSLPSVVVGTPYSATLFASGGIPPYTWSVSAGSLPAGLTLSPGGLISGTPTTQGSYSFTIQVIDSAP